MSGGYFNYDQWKISEIADDVERLVYKNGRAKTDKELIDDWFPEEKYHYAYPEEVVEEFKKGLDILKKAYVYAQRIDWLLSGDDGEDNFLRRLKEDLGKLKESK